MVGLKHILVKLIYMKNTVNLISVLLVFYWITGCNSNPYSELSGVWVGNCRATYFNNDPDTFSISYEMIMEINDDSITFRNYTHVLYDKVNASSVAYYIDDDTIVIGNNPEFDRKKFTIIDKNQLELSDSNSNIIYTRFVESTAALSTLELRGKMFSISFENEIIDTIEFLDESSVLVYNGSKDQFRAASLFPWITTRYRNYNIIKFDPYQLSFIFKEGENKYVLKQSPTNDRAYTFETILIKQRISKDDLIGEWSGYSEFPPNDLYFRFDQDSVLMNDGTGGELKTFKYDFSVSGKYLFTSFNEIIYMPMLYRITALNCKQIELKRRVYVADKFVLSKAK